MAEVVSIADHLRKRCKARGALEAILEEPFPAHMEVCDYIILRLFEEGFIIAHDPKLDEEEDEAG